MLPPIDIEFLDERAPGYSVTSEAGMTCVVIPSLPLPPGFDQKTSDLLLRLSGGYPDVHPDMWWFNPPIRRTDGVTIPATESHEQHLGRTWQRWSRHLQPAQWRSGVDCLRTYVALIHKELRAAAPAAAAA